MCLAATISRLFIPVPFLVKVGSFLISPDLVASQLLLEISHCIPLPLQSVSSHLISSGVFSAFFTTSHLVSCLLSSSPLFSADHNCSHLLCHLSFSHLFSAHLASFLFNPSQILHSNAARLNSTLLSSPPLFSCQAVSTHPISSNLSSSHNFSALLNFS